MLRIIAVLFGIAFIFIGVSGFLPQFTNNDLLFGYFHANMIHNLVHIGSGVLAIMAATAKRFTIIYFQLIGLIYLIIAIFGYWYGGNLIIMHVNLADNILHGLIGVFALYLGFYGERSSD